MAAIETLSMRIHMGEAIDWKREVMSLINLASNGRPLPTSTPDQERNQP